jgi:hypothetical protein
MRVYPPGDPRSNKGKAWDDMRKHQDFLYRKEMEKKKQEAERKKKMGIKPPTKRTPTKPTKPATNTTAKGPSGSRKPMIPSMGPKPMPKGPSTGRGKAVPMPMPKKQSRKKVY